MKLGCQSAPSTDAHFAYFARYGVRNVCGYPEIPEGRLYATPEELKRLRELGDRHGISIDHDVLADKTRVLGFRAREFGHAIHQLEQSLDQLGTILKLRGRPARSLRAGVLQERRGRR